MFASGIRRVIRFPSGSMGIPVGRRFCASSSSSSAAKSVTRMMNVIRFPSGSMGIPVGRRFCVSSSSSSAAKSVTRMMNVIVVLPSGEEKSITFTDGTSVIDATNYIRGTFILQGGGFKVNDTAVLTTDILHSEATYRFENGVSAGNII